MTTDGLTFVPGVVGEPAAAMKCLGEPLAAWVANEFGTPTHAQRLAWPALQRGEHLLLSAPTGSGKTLAAFAPILAGLSRSRPDLPVCLYVAPLKALARDVVRNLRRWRNSLRHRTGETWRMPIALRTGDTSSTRRRRQLERPPAVLATTPESLAILLSQAQGRAFLSRLRWVVIDEVHALVGNKRGADLALSLERIEALLHESNLPPLQRIGLSATCMPLELAARFLVGQGRPCRIASVAASALLQLTVAPLPPEPTTGPRTGFMARLLEALEPVLRRHRTTLVFTNIRSIAERVTWALRRRWPRLARRFAVHHSSLAPERRRRVEQALKKGRLRVVVSSTSLELGIDIGSVEAVVFVHPPGGVVRLLQRVGRSGHRPGEPRRGLLLTSGPADLLEAIVTAAAGRAGQLEPLETQPQPLDVLCQHVAGMAIDAWWDPIDALRIVRRSQPFADLDEEDWRRCLDYLSGRHADGRSWVTPRLRWEDGRFTLRDRRTAILLRRNLGSILNEDPRGIRLLLPGRNHRGKFRTLQVGSLDESYAEGLRPGDRFVLDGRCFEFRREQDGAILVDEVSTRPLVPHWMGNGWVVARELARRSYHFRLQAAEYLREGEQVLSAWLEGEHGLGAEAREEVAALFHRQEAVSEVPDARTLLLEMVPTETGQDVYLHTPLNRAGNDALARVLVRRLSREEGGPVDFVVADLGLLLALPHARTWSADRWRSLLERRDFEADLRQALTDSRTLRERFARVATVGLMVLRQPWGGRRKVGGRDWAARRLFDQVRQADPDFLLLRQAENEVLSQACDAAAARDFLDLLPRMTLRLRTLERPSPLAESWTQPADMRGEASEDVPDPHSSLARLHRELWNQLPG